MSWKRSYFRQSSILRKHQSCSEFYCCCFCFAALVGCSFQRYAVRSVRSEHMHHAYTIHVCGVFRTVNIKYNNFFFLRHRHRRRRWTMWNKVHNEKREGVKINTNTIHGHGHRHGHGAWAHTLARVYDLLIECENAMNLRTLCIDLAGRCDASTAQHCI